jgi:hypothetical protein
MRLDLAFHLLGMENAFRKEQGCSRTCKELPSFTGLSSAGRIILAASSLNIGANRNNRSWHNRSSTASTNFATAAECARTLHAAGARTVGVLAVARVLTVTL